MLGERLHQEAVCRHFGVLTLAEIRHICEWYGMTLAEFANISDLGDASLRR